MAIMATATSPATSAAAIRSVSISNRKRHPPAQPREGTLPGDPARESPAALSPGGPVLLVVAATHRRLRTHSAPGAMPIDPQIDVIHSPEKTIASEVTQKPLGRHSRNAEPAAHHGGQDFAAFQRAPRRPQPACNGSEAQQPPQGDSSLMGCRRVPNCSTRCVQTSSGPMPESGAASEKRAQPARPIHRRQRAGGLSRQGPA